MVTEKRVKFKSVTYMLAVWCGQVSVLSRLDDSSDDVDRADGPTLVVPHVMSWSLQDFQVMSPVAHHAIAIYRIAARLRSIPAETPPCYKLRGASFAPWYGASFVPKC